MAAYSEAERRDGQRLMVLEGVFSRAMDSLTGGVVLAAFALALGATDLQIGLIAAVPFLAQLAHVPALALLARWQDRKPLAVWAVAGARCLLVVMGLLPFLSLPHVPALIALLVAYAVLATFSGAAWQVWIRDLVEREELGRYHGRRFAVLALVGFVAVLAAGQAIAGWHRAQPDDPFGGFALLYAGGAVLGLASCAILQRAPSHPSPAPIVAGFRESLRRPLREGNWRRVLLFLSAWGFAANLALPFVSVVLLRVLGYGLGVVAALAAVSMAANFLGFRLWAPLIDRFGAKPVLGLNGALFVVSIAAWAVLPDVAGQGVLVGAVALHTLLGLATSGIDLASTALTMKLAPPDEAPAYLATASVAKAVATGVAPLLAGLALTFLGERSVKLSLSWASGGKVDAVTIVAFSQHDLLFLLSALLGVYALHRLLAFSEPGEAAPEHVVRAMRRDMGGVSSVAGMRQFAHLASYLVDAALRVERSLEIHPDRRSVDRGDEEDEGRGSARPEGGG